MGCSDSYITNKEDLKIKVKKDITGIDNKKN